jgi:hypothetical protein
MNYLFYNYYSLFRKYGTYTSFEFAASNLLSLFCFWNLLAIALLAHILGLFDVFKLNKYYLIGFSIILLVFILWHFTRQKVFKIVIKRFDNISKRWSFFIPFWTYITISFFLPLLLLFYT